MINCKVCGEEFKPKSSNTKICSDECREIQKIESKKKWRTKTPDHRKAWSNYAYKWRNKNPERNKVSVFKAKSLKLGLPFDLDEEFFNNIPLVCPVLGIVMDGKTKESTWSVDKIIPSRGYTKDNCRIISVRANRLKNDSSKEELEKILAYILENEEKNDD